MIRFHRMALRLAECVLLLTAGLFLAADAARAQAPSPGTAPPAIPAREPAPAPGQTPGKASMPAPSWDFDPPHCSIIFFVKHIFAKVPGRFDGFSGTVRFDPQNLDGSQIDVSVDMTTVNTNVAKRDEDLKSPNFLETDKYPAMWFVSQRIASKGGNEYVAEGDLTIKDVTKRIQLPFTFLGSKPSPLAPGKQVAGFESRFSVNMLDFHVSDGHYQRMGMLGDTVEIIMNMELLR